MSWDITGNSDTDPNVNFLGTTDAQPLVVKTNGQEVLRFDTVGNVGIGTLIPQNQLHVGSGSSSIFPSRVNTVFASINPDAGIAIAQNSGVNVLLQASGGGGYIGTTSNHPLVFRTNDLDRMVINTDGNLRVGTGSSSIAPSRVNAVFASVNPDAGIAIAQNSGVNVLLQASGGGGFIGTTSNHPLVFRTNDLDRMVIDTNGNVRVTSIFGKSEAGEGVHGETNSPIFAAVAGIQLNPASTGAGVYGEHRGTGPAGFFKGDVLVTGDIKLINADCAEDFDIAGLAKVEPGTVMVIDSEGALRESDQAYDKRVAGVISGAGNYKPGLILDKQQDSSSNRMPIALMGKVYCKVDASYGAIEVGDLLTTSPTPGYAMKADDPMKAFGSVIGKALRPLGGGQGLIPILIALQ
jgi:hypothetical protein